jgi:ribosomal protein S18 acetylase RimI-like enzyme
MTEPVFEYCDYENPTHLNALVSLLNHYMADPMGDHAPLTTREQLRLVDGLANHPGAFVLFIVTDGVYAGMVTCFELFSTFQVKPYLYIHDVVVHRDFRGLGLGRKMLEQLIVIAQERAYCKITLEVREDNLVAQLLYRSLGFDDCEPQMLFWTKKL